MHEAPDDVEELARRRAEARKTKDFASADALRDEIVAAGWEVTDEPSGYALRPVAAEQAGPISAAAVESVLGDAPAFDVSLQWVCEGWPEDIERAIGAFRSHAGTRRVQYVVADVTGLGAGHFGDDVELLALEEGTGWAAARNAGFKRASAPVVVALDGSIEPTGDAITPLVDSLKDDHAGVVGPFGIVTSDLREFQEADGEGPCDAVEGYLMALRRETLDRAGFFDEKFRWYRTADIEWSFRVKDAGMECRVVDVPVRKHAHRMWFETDPKERARWSKRNFYRFLDRFRDRWDLVLSGEPEHHDHDDDHDHHHEGPVTLPEGR